MRLTDRYWIRTAASAASMAPSAKTMPYTLSTSMPKACAVSLSYCVARMIRPTRVLVSTSQVSSRNRMDATIIASL